jgi:hypothetical protein
VGTFVLLGQAVVRDPDLEEGLKLVEGGLSGRAQLVELLGKEWGEGGAVWGRH